jgi:hypothetical protein
VKRRKIQWEIQRKKIAKKNLLFLCGEREREEHTAGKAVNVENR